MVSTLMTFWNLLLRNLSLSSGVKLLRRDYGANGRNATLLDVTCCVRLHTLLHVVAYCRAKFETGQTFSPAYVYKWLLSPIHKNRAVDNGKLLTPSHRPQTI